MGGHGGLNILPQKKWNVYNYDNRAIVEKDKKLAAAKKRKQFEKSRERALQMKLQVLGEEKAPEKNQQRHFIPVKHQKHFNLFEQEEAIVKNGTLNEYKKKISEKYIKSQGIEQDGVQLKSTALPWYAKKKHTKQEKNKNREQKWESVEAKKTNSVAIQEYYASEAQRIKEKKHHKEEKQQQFERGAERERSRQKPRNKSEMEILREKRLKREKKQRERALKLMNK